MLVIGVHKSYRARPKSITRTVNRDLDGPFANQPHFGVHVVVWWMGHAPGLQRRLMNFQRFARGKLALQNIANFGVVRCSMA